MNLFSFKVPKPIFKKRKGQEAETDEPTEEPKFDEDTLRKIEAFWS